jgi:hypothetical protein
MHAFTPPPGDLSPAKVTHHVATAPPSRRALFAGAGALLAGAAISTGGGIADPAANADAELIALCAEFCQLEREWLALVEAELDDDDPHSETRHERQGEIAEFIEEHPPQTLEGFRAVAYAAVLWAPDMWEDSFNELGGLHGTLNSALLRGLLGGVKP